MVMADGMPLVETCVLLPEEFALKVEPEPRVSPLLHLLPHLTPPFTPLSSPLGALAPGLPHLGPPLGRLSPSENCVKVCATRRLPPQTRYLPFSGTVRADKLPALPSLTPVDPRQRYGSYDEVVERGEGRVRLCNWVRFVSYSLHFSHHVNMVASRVRGSVVFEVVREVVPGEKLLVFLMPDMSGEDTLLLPALSFLRSSLYRRTIDSIMAEAPLDLSRSLLTSPTSSSPSDATPPEVSKKRPHQSQSPLRPSSPSPPPPEQTSSSPFPSIPSSFFPLRRPNLGLSPRELDSSGAPSPFPLNLRPPPASSGISSGLPSSLPSRSSTTSVPQIKETSLSLMPPKRRERTMLPCSECGKAFDRPSLLKRHIRTHTGEKPHVCDVCGKGFSTSSSLNTHRRIHSGEKPHQCGVCGKRFTASSNLYYHKMTHIKEKPHKCSLCTRSFPTPGDLRSHMFVHNGQWPHKCSVCGKGFSKLTNLRNHALLHTELKRADRQLMLQGSPTLPATSGSDNPLTPPSAHTPPVFSIATASTSQTSAESETPVTSPRPLQSSSPIAASSSASSLAFTSMTPPTANTSPSPSESQTSYVEYSPDSPHSVEAKSPSSSPMTETSGEGASSPPTQISKPSDSQAKSNPQYLLPSSSPSSLLNAHENETDLTDEQENAKLEPEAPSPSPGSKVMLSLAISTAPSSSGAKRDSTQRNIIASIKHQLSPLSSSIDFPCGSKVTSEAPDGDEDEVMFIQDKKKTDIVACKVARISEGINDRGSKT